MIEGIGNFIRNFLTGGFILFMIALLFFFIGLLFSFLASLGLIYLTLVIPFCFLAWLIGMVYNDK